MQLSSRCYAVTGLGYAPPWCVNAGFIAGDAITLVVDTGANALSAQTIHGYAASVRPRNALRVINTEKHFDHIGGNGFFKARGVEIWGHAGIARTEAEFAAEIEEFNNLIPNAARRHAREAAVFFDETALANPDIGVREDTRMDLGNSAAEILVTPGHTSTNLSVWIRGEGVLYAGDCLIAGYLPNLDAGRPGDWRTWLESLARIQALKPEVIVAGHGPVARGAEVPRMIARVRSVVEAAIELGKSPTSDQSPLAMRSSSSNS